MGDSAAPQKQNSTSKASSSHSSIPKHSDLTKPAAPKNKTAKPVTPPKEKKPQVQTRKREKTQKIVERNELGLEEEEEEDLISEFRDLPNRFHRSLIPDLEKLSTTSREYMNKASAELTAGFKPLVGKKYASPIASLVCFAFILIPFLLVSLIFNRIKAYFSLQKLMIVIQAYLAVYFTILCVTSLVTGLEPLRFFYTMSQTTYICMQVVQAVAYLLYLLLLLMYLVLVFSTGSSLEAKLLGLFQAFVGFAVGLHYYVKVFHRIMMRQQPRASWKVHAIYATCFVLVCLLAKAERRKKSYLEESGEQGKKS